ncbi:MAG: Sec-dependent nitrous-oxide reductase [Gemmataceae bacterium]
MIDRAKCRTVLHLGLFVVLGMTLPGCGGCSGSKAPSADSLAGLMHERGLSEDDVVAALKTYTPTGKHDTHYLMASGGHCGQLLVIGVPSMRILKYVGVFTPEPWQGYGFDDDTRKLLRDSSPPDMPLTWGDVHHPALSETKGDYDGEFVFVNDKANARVAVISLKDFNTVQIVRGNILRSDHGGTFVTPDTDYVIESGQYPVPLNGSYTPLDQAKYNEVYRSAVIFWKFDRQRGRIAPEDSFALELPPYMQDIADVGKLASDGWAFLNSFNTERAIGGDAEGQPALESGASQNDMDYLHVINWRKAEQVAKQGRTQTVRGMRLIPLKTAIEEGLLYFVPEPKSPHGVDVTPDGNDICVSGKLDTHVTVYSFEQIKRYIDAKQFAGNDAYGVPILPFKETIRGQVQVGLGPLHTQFDGAGHGYTSLFIESKVVRWSLQDLKALDSIPVHYNVGHICVAGGDTVHPDGRYLISMNKWSIDRFAPVGPLLPQNFQLIDVAGDKMRLLYDMPIGLGEPHYAQMIAADKIKPLEFYSPVGINQVTHQPDPNAATDEKKARVERHGNVVDVYMTAIRSHFVPDTLRVRQGDTVHVHLTSLEQTRDATHGFAINHYNVNLSLEPGKTANVTFVADKAGVYPIYCSEFCSALHLEMSGYLLVEPRKQ